MLLKLGYYCSSGLKSLLACMQTSRLEPILLSPWSSKLTIIIIQLSYTAWIPIFWLLDLYHVTLGYDKTTPLMSLLWCYNSRCVNSTHHCHCIHWPQSKVGRKCQANFSFCHRTLGILKKLRNFLPFHILPFHFILYYSCVVYHNLPHYLVKRLQRIQTACASFVVG